MTSPSKPLGWQRFNGLAYPDCLQCRRLYVSAPFFLAIAQVSLENWYDPEKLERRVIEDYHANGHPAVP